MGKPALKTTADSPRESALTDSDIERLHRARPLLRGLLAVGAGFAADSSRHSWRIPKRTGQAVLLYCVRGGGWCEVAGRLVSVHKGDLAVVAAGNACRFGPHSSGRWGLHWVCAVGDLLPDYLRELAVGLQKPVLHIGEDPRVLRLFNEIFRSLQRGSAYPGLLRASHALGYLLSSLIDRPKETAGSSDTVQKVAEAIIYMSEHLEEPFRVVELARLAGLSSDYFAELFKQQTGSPPRDYLRLLRVHRACEFLRETQLSVKEVASRLGYKDQFHFSRQFKASQGVSPSGYRKSGPC